MVSLDDVARLALALPGVTEIELHGRRAWQVGGNRFAWERPFSKADVKRFAGAPVPEGPIVALATDGLDDKEALLASRPGHLFTIPHFEGYAAVLMLLDEASEEEATEALLDAWLVHVPAEIARRHLKGE
jgi:hypothetical protein